MGEAVVCASCPEAYHDQVARLCLEHGVQKAFGRAGDMVNSLAGKDWIPKWEAKVVMATVTKAQTLQTNKALILCVAGGKNCDAEMARQPALVRAIKTEMVSSDFRVRVEWIEIDEFLERYPDRQGKSKDHKGSKGHVEGQAKAKAQASKNTAKDSDQGSKGYVEGQAKAKAQASKNTAKDSDQGKKPCKYWLQGECKNGTSCNYLHGKPNPEIGKGKQSGNKPPQEQGKTCKYWLQGECKNGSGCAFLHPKDAGPAAQKREKAPAGMTPDSKARKDAQRAAKKEKKVLCLECGRKFKNWDDMLAKHLLCKGQPPLCVCADCNKEFDDDVACAQHQSAKGHEGLIRVNDVPDLWTCICGAEFGDRHALCQHQKSRLHGDAAVCEVCQKEFDSIPALLQHQGLMGHSGRPLTKLLNDYGAPFLWPFSS